MSAMDYETEARPYDEAPRDYDAERSRSPRGERREENGSAMRNRSASPGNRDRERDRDRDRIMPDRPADPLRRVAAEDDGDTNPGTNLFVTGLHPSLSEGDVARLFEKYGDVEKCNIMRDPHTQDSRGFGFVNMVTAEQANAAKEGLQGTMQEGRTLSIEKARRSRPRTPTPGKYYGPPKPDDRRRGGWRGGGDRYDRRGYNDRRDDYRTSRPSRFDDRHDDRSYRDRYRDREDYRPVDRYASSGRDDRHGRGDYEDRRGGGRYGGRDEGRPPYGEGPPPPRTDDREAGYGGSGGGRPYDDRGDDRYSRRY